MMNWKEVPGTNGRYEISIDTPEGKCRSNNWNNTKQTRELSNKVGKEGRIFWTLRIDAKNATQQAARWIAITYPELVQNEYFPGAQIDHIDTDRLNNHPSNLRWVTQSANNRNPITLGRMSEAAKRRNPPTEETRKKMSESRKGKLFNRPDQSKWVIKLSLENEILYFYPSVAEAARANGLFRENISACCRGKHKTAGGYIWKYAE